MEGQLQAKFAVLRSAQENTTDSHGLSNLNPNMNFILLPEVIRIKPMLKLNEILNQALLKDKIEEIIQSAVV